MRTLPILILSATLAAGPAVSGAVSFSSGWNEQRLSLFRSNDYRFGEQLGIVSDGAVSLAWKRLPRSEWQARSASWSWRVDQSVPPTDLGRKGGDDRNISLYFVFLPEAEANALEGANIRQLMGNDNVRILQYVWGGNHGRDRGGNLLHLLRNLRRHGSLINFSKRGNQKNSSVSPHPRRRDYP